MLDLIVTGLLFVNIFLDVSIVQGSSKGVKSARIKLVNVGIVLVLETIITYQHILANESYFFNILIIILEVVVLFSTIVQICGLKKKEATQEEKSKDRCENNNHIVV